MPSVSKLCPIFCGSGKRLGAGLGSNNMGVVNLLAMWCCCVFPECTNADCLQSNSAILAKLNLAMENLEKEYKNGRLDNWTRIRLF